MSLNNSNDTIENRTRDLPVCSAVHYATYRASPSHPPLNVGALANYTVMLVRVGVFSDMTPCRWVHGCRRSEVSLLP